MSDEFEIKSVRDSFRLRFLQPERSSPSEAFEYWRVELSGPVTAAVRVYDINAPAIAEFFGEMARQWRGWRDVKRWGSIEAQLELEATATSLGQISLRVKLREDFGGADWRVETTLMIEAGQLESIARAAKRFFAPAKED